MTPEAQLIEAFLRVATKDGEDVDFHLNSAQRILDSKLTGRDLVPKARQEGVSTYVLARFFMACLMHRNTRAVVISHDAESTQRLFSRVRYFIDNFRGPAPVTQNLSKNEITFPKTGGMFYIGTAGSRKFGRGDTITHLHCSEYAYWPDAPTLMTGLMQAVPMSGEVVIESTGNGYNDYYSRCMRAYQGQGVWGVHFLPWHTFPEYQLELDERDAAIVRRTLNEEWDEPALLAAGLTPGQIAWRRMKLDELNYDLRAFRQEYPMTLDECFQMSSDSIFYHVLYEPTERWKQIDRGYWQLEGHPIVKGVSYVLGADVSAGVGADSSVIEVFCCETGEQVAEFITNALDPDVFSKKILEIGEKFNFPYAVVEANNHGILTLDRLRHSYPFGRLYSQPNSGNTEEKRITGYGYRTTARNKPLMIGKLRSALATEWTIHSPLLRMQLSTFIETENGRLQAQDGCFDDAVMAAACAVMGRERAALVYTEPIFEESKIVDPFSFEGIVTGLSRRGTRYGLRRQIN